MRDIRHFIDGAAFDGASGRFSDVFNPNTGDVQARVQLATVSEMDRAVQAAQAAFEGWSSTNPQRRARVAAAGSTPAVEAARRAFANGGDAPETWLVLARALSGCGRHDEADDAYRMGLVNRVVAEGEALAAAGVTISLGHTAATAEEVDAALTSRMSVHIIYEFEIV